MFLGKGQFVTPYKKTDTLVSYLAKLYSPVARYRVTRMDGRSPIESVVGRALGLFGRQE
jgi:hypothetical protein